MSTSATADYFYQLISWQQLGWCYLTCFNNERNHKWQKKFLVYIFSFALLLVTSSQATSSLRHVASLAACRCCFVIMLLWPLHPTLLCDWWKINRWWWWWWICDVFILSCHLYTHYSRLLQIYWGALIQLITVSCLGGNDKNAVVFNKDTEQVVAILQGHAKKVTGVIYHPDEVLLWPLRPLC